MSQVGSEPITHMVCFPILHHDGLLSVNYVFSLLLFPTSNHLVGRREMKMFLSADAYLGERPAPYLPHCLG